MSETYVVSKAVISWHITRLHSVFDDAMVSVAAAVYCITSRDSPCSTYTPSLSFVELHVGSQSLQNAAD